jgi:hypothetical protein
MSKNLSRLLALCLLSASVSIAAADCSILSAAEVQKLTGTAVHDIAKQSQPGAGGTCANYATDNGKLYLGVNQLTSASDYNTAVAAVPQSVYPKREKLTDIGDETVLMKDESGMLRYLVARKGNRGVVLFPFHHGPNDEQLKKLAVQALSH